MFRVPIHRPLALVGLVNAVAASTLDAEEVTKQALEADEQCDSEEGSCALHAIQLRGQKLDSAHTEQRGEGAPHHHPYHSCWHYGCSPGYKKHHRCQCNAECVQHGNCCQDYATKCQASTTTTTEMAVEEQTTTEEPAAPTPGEATATGGVYGHPTPGKVYPEYEGFTLALVEEFDEPMDLDTDPIWTWSDGGLSEGNIRFVKEAITFEDGKMKITASTQQYETQSCSNAEVGHIGHKKLSSGEFRSKHNMFRYGRYEAHIKAPSVKPDDASANGNYISTMFVYRDAKYHHWREIDWEITGDSPHSVTTNVLSANNRDSWSASIADSRQFKLDVNTRTDFHTYAIEWLPDSITWFVDGKEIRKKHGPGGRVPISDKSAKIMMNLWIFGDGAYFGGHNIHNNHYPMHSEYDWFRFYRWDGDQEYPCPGMGADCLSTDDMYLSSNNPCDGIEQQGTVHGKEACKSTCKSR